MSSNDEAPLVPVHEDLAAVDEIVLDHGDLAEALPIHLAALKARGHRGID